MNREWLERHQIAVYFGSVAVAAIAGLAAASSARAIEGLITPAIAVLMYAMFLQIPFLSLRTAFGSPRFVAALLVANFVAVPLLVWALTSHLEDHRAIMLGALLVLLTPCIDYVVVFTHLGKGDFRLVLSATPILLILQFTLLPFYLWLMLGGDGAPSIPFAPFLEAFLLLIAAPFILAVATEMLGRRSRTIRAWQNGWLWLPVPAMAAVLMLVVGSQIGSIVQDFAQVVPVIPVYLAFAIFAPLAGLLTARIFRLPAPAARAVSFSAATRNSLVVLPLALALPADLRLLAATAVIAQTMVELFAELLYLKAIPALMPDRAVRS